MQPAPKLPPIKLDQATKARILAEVHDSAFALGYRHGPQWLLIWSKMRDRVTIEPAIKTLAVSADGRLFVSPDYWSRCTGPERQGLIAHEMLHPTLLHFDRARALGMIDAEGKAILGRDRDLGLWNFAGDMAINPVLIASGMTLPRGVCLPPSDYTGPQDTESLWHWLRSQAQKQGNGQGQKDSRGDANPGEGCGSLPPADQKGDQQGQAPGQTPGQTPGQGPIDWAKVARDAKAIAETCAKGIGRGSAEFARLLSPVPPRLDWRKVLGQGFSIADSRTGRDRPTYSKVSRRQSAPFIRPGWIQTIPRVTVIVDCSGSMDRSWLDRIAAEILKLISQYQGASCYLIAHTDRVEWQGKVTGKAKIQVALGCTGGTDAHEAYEIARGIRSDVCIHFTDCEIGFWPEAPAGQRLVIGAFGNGATNPSSKPPEHARLIPCTNPSE